MPQITASTARRWTVRSFSSCADIAFVSCADTPLVVTKESSRAVDTRAILRICNSFGSDHDYGLPADPSQIGRLRLNATESLVSWPWF